MIEIKYDLTTYHRFLQQAAKAVDSKVIGNTVIIPDRKGTGYLKHIVLDDGADAMLSCFRLNEDLLVERKKNNKEYYTFCCDLLSDAGDFRIRIGSDSFTQDEEDLSAMYLTSYLFDVGYYIKKESVVKSVRILLTPEWMIKNLQFDEKKEVVQQYLNLKIAGVLVKRPDAEAREIMASIFDPGLPVRSPLFYQSRLLWLLEKFASWLTPELISRPMAVDISRNEIEKVREIEMLLTRDFSATPPTLARLAQMIAVSESKLKTLFKAVYGLPVYEYFQKHRMEKARVMLLSREFSIKDVGYAVGYANLSNFTLAFKKQFSQLPSDLLK